jgi:hypothetical protein
MYIDKEGFEWGERTDPVGAVHLFTNRTLMVFTPEGYQMPCYQKTMGRKILKEIAQKGEKFYINQFRKWCHEISKEEFMALLCIREETL